jgi:hypothetical protein
VNRSIPAFCHGRSGTSWLMRVSFVCKRSYSRHSYLAIHASLINGFPRTMQASFNTYMSNMNILLDLWSDKHRDYGSFATECYTTRDSDFVMVVVKRELSSWEFFEWRIIVNSTIYMNSTFNKSFCFWIITLSAVPNTTRGDAIRCFHSLVRSIA